MVADSRPSRWRARYKRTNCQWYSKKVDQFSWLAVRETFPAYLLFLFLLFFLLASFATAAETPDSSRHTIIHGLIATAQGQPVAGATVELRDLRGIKMAVGSTDDTGRFALTAVANPGKYILLVTKELQITDEQILVDQGEREVAITLPGTAGSAAAKSQQLYTVSAQQLRVPEKARAHLKLAQQEFSRLNLSGAEQEIDQALQIDSMCAAAFSMRAVLRLAARDPKRAIEDA